MTMLQKLNTDIFYWINQSGTFHTGWLDSVMLMLSNKVYAVPLLLITIVFLFLRGWQQGKWVLLGVIILIGITDLSGGLLKHLTETPRPCQALTNVRMLVSCAGYSFPSNHALNTAAFAIYLGLFYRMLLPWLLLLPLLVGISRIYIGVHYPIDVLAGWLLGAAYAYVFYLITKQGLEKWIDRRNLQHDMLTEDEKAD